MSDFDIHRELGALSARVSALEKDIEEMRIDIKQVVKFVTETKGGWKYLWGIVGLAASLGTVAGAIFTYWRIH